MGGAGTSPSFQPDHFALGAATLALLATAAAKAPVIAAVDDAQWLDQASVEALAFMARRLLAEGVVLLLTRRVDEGSSALDTLPSTRIGGLTPTAAAKLLRRKGARAISSSRVEQLVAASGGNPLALMELPRLIDEQELAGLIPTHKPLPIGDALLKAYAARFDMLADSCRQAAAIVALLSESDLVAVNRALSAGQLSIADLADAEDSGLVDVGPAGVSFRHPLARSAAVYSIPPSWRRRAHTAVSRSLADSDSVNKRVECAWHLAAAATGPDEQTAAMLEGAAEQAAAQSAWGAATPAYERAAQLSPDDANRHRRYVLAADVASHAGLIAKSRELLAAADKLGGR